MIHSISIYIAEKLNIAMQYHAALARRDAPEWIETATCYNRQWCWIQHVPQ